MYISVFCRLMLVVADVSGRVEWLISAAKLRIFSALYCAIHTIKMDICTKISMDYSTKTGINALLCAMKWLSLQHEEKTCTNGLLHFLLLVYHVVAWCP